MRICKRHKINWRLLLVIATGLIVFAALNILMLHTNFKTWTNPRLGFYYAFHKGFEFSGFDGPTYIVISKWRPLYTLFRHPMLALMIWPLSKLNGWLMPATGMNCAIFIVATVWTFVSTCSWVLLHKLINRVVGLGFWVSLLLCAFYFGTAYVMLATFVPDHMILSMTLFLLVLWLACKADSKGKPLKTWQALVITFLSMGIATTNCVKIWLADMMSRVGRSTWRSAFMHSLLYFIPVLFVGAIYLWQIETTQNEEVKFAQGMVDKQIAAGKLDRKKVEEKKEKRMEEASKQIFESSYFEWTDASIGRWPLLYENVFGEGFMLHEDHLLEDANKNRPVFVTYRHWWYYAIEAVIIAMFVAGVWFGRRERLMWMLLAMFSVDALLHIGLCFAASDVYIMTAHWAFIVPVAVAYLIRSTRSRQWVHTGIIAMVAIITVFLWWHNVSLIAGHILHTN